MYTGDAAICAGKISHSYITGIYTVGWHDVPLRGDSRIGCTQVHPCSIHQLSITVETIFRKLASIEISIGGIYCSFRRTGHLPSGIIQPGKRTACA